MVQLKLAALALLSINVFTVFANQGQVIIENIEELPEDGAGISDPIGQPAAQLLQVLATASFPDTDVFGVKLVNGRPSVATIRIYNAEPEPVNVRIVGGSLYPLEAPSDTGDIAHAVRNLTSKKIETVIKPASNISIAYPLTMNMRPQDLRLILAAVVENNLGQSFQVNGFNGTVGIVETPFSIFDPETLFIYVFMLGLLAGTCYFIYITWAPTLFPQAKKQPFRKTAAPVQSAVTSTGASTPAYDPSWISERHLPKPDTKRTRSSTPKEKASKS